MVEDAGYSAKSLKCPDIQSALARLKDGEAEALVTAQLDRLIRSMLDLAGIMADAQKPGWSVVCLDLGVDTTTPTGSLRQRAGILAQFERRLIGQHTKDALAMKRAEGVTPGRPRALPESVRTRIVSERRGGATVTAIADGLNREGVATAQGGRKWWPSTVRAALQRPFEEAILRLQDLALPGELDCLDDGI